MSAPISADAPLDDRGLPIGGRPFKPEWEITPREIKERLDAGDPTLALVDCRRPEEHEFCRIDAPGSRFLPMQEAWTRLNELDDLRAKDVVLYCHTGRRSLWMAAFLRQSGFENVRSMAGGIDVWAIDIDPSIPRY